MKSCSDCLYKKKQIGLKLFFPFRSGMDFSIITKIWLIFYRDHPFSTWAKFSEKLTFLTTWYAHVRQIQRKYLWSGFFNSRPSTLSILLDKGRKLSVHKSFRRRPICFLNVLYTFNLRPVARGIPPENIRKPRVLCSQYV